ncbi:Colicin V production protein [Planctomycetes bacterium Pan216]|uniref:Colicin V production protein n=1 Tax=Kolteria novifilia TaxID=2527975 RepID=A0A518B1S3_9BACT|nr:Colicin V production protein [Planctomycetes bacterium Pan216]
MGFDIFFGIILLLGAFHGYRKGFANQVIQLSGIILGVVFSQPLAKALLPLADKYATAIPSPLRLPALSLASILTIWLLFTFVFSLMLMAYRKKVFGDNKPSSGDRFFGIGVGLAQASFFVLVGVFCVDHAPGIVRDMDLFKTQYDSSQVIETANRYHVVDQLIETKEVQQVRQSIGQIVHYYSDEADDMTENVASDLPTLR